MILIVNRIDFFLTMLTEEMNATIGPSCCGKSAAFYRTFKYLRIFLMIPLDMEVK